MTMPATPRKAPHLSVIVPAFDEERTLGQVIDSVLALVLALPRARAAWREPARGRRQLVPDRARPGERPIGFVPRGDADGKSIDWKDGVQAVATIAKWRVLTGREGSGRRV